MMGWDDASNKQSGMSSAAPDMDRMVYKLARYSPRWSGTGNNSD